MADFLFTWKDGSQTLDCGWHVTKTSADVTKTGVKVTRLPRSNLNPPWTVMPDA